MSDNQLGSLLRAYRERRTPQEAGLPTSGARRTPGLRRSEVATLAGVSVEYLTRLEQGRDRHPSHQILGALSDALGLSTEERTLLLRAAKGADGRSCFEVADPQSEVRPTMRALLERLEPTPAVVLNRLYDVLAYTSGYHRLMAPVGLFDGVSANLARYVFTHPRAGDALPDWSAVADAQVYELKAGSSKDDPHLAEFADELAVVGGAIFSERFAAQLVTPGENRSLRIVHPEVGELRLDYEMLDIPGTGVVRLVAYLPADEASSGALDRLVDRRPGRLHAVAN